MAAVSVVLISIYSHRSITDTRQHIHTFLTSTWPLQVHVIPRFQLSGTYGAPAADFLPHQDQQSYEHLIKSAEAFIGTRVLKNMEAATNPPPLVHIIKYETDSDSIGTVLCKKADELNAAVLVVSRHTKSKLQQFFLGSVSGFCVQHSKRPVLVHHWLFS